MRVYDIIQTVEHGARTSEKAGVRWIESRDRREEAEETARIYNHHACAGVSYSVEEIDESSPDRKLS